MSPPAPERVLPAPGRTSVPLAPLTTLGLGGLAATVIELTHTQEMPAVAAEFDAAEGSTPVPLGGGSNVLVADAGVRRPVLLVRTRGVRRHALPDGRVLVTAQAGHTWQDLLDELLADGLTGAEALAGIPGTVGAMPVQNVGAYGQDIAGTLMRVVAWDWHLGRHVVLGREDCRFGHRTSIFKNTHRWLILEVGLALRPGPLGMPVTYQQVARQLGVRQGTRVPVSELSAAVVAVRHAKGMVLAGAGEDARSAGSVFSSPAVDPPTARRLAEAGASVHTFPDGARRVSASWLLENSGYVLGQPVAEGVRLSKRQFTLVAGPGATTAGFVEATRRVQERVLRRTGVRLQPELDAVGRLPRYDRLLDFSRLDVAVSSR